MYIFDHRGNSSRYYNVSSRKYRRKTNKLSKLIDCFGINQQIGHFKVLRSSVYSASLNSIELLTLRKSICFIKAFEVTKNAKFASIKKEFLIF